MVGLWWVYGGFMVDLLWFMVINGALWWSMGNILVGGLVYPTPLKHDGLCQLDDDPNQISIPLGYAKKNFGRCSWGYFYNHGYVIWLCCIMLYIYLVHWNCTSKYLNMFLREPRPLFLDNRSDRALIMTSCSHVESPIPHPVQVSEWTVSKICWMKGNWVRSTWFGAVVFFPHPTLFLPTVQVLLPHPWSYIPPRKGYYVTSRKSQRRETPYSTNVVYPFTGTEIIEHSSWCQSWQRR